MPVRQEKKIIKDSEGNDHEYFVIQKPAMQGEKLKFKLLAMVGPSIKLLKDIAGNQTKGKDKEKVTPEKALEVFGEIIGDLFERNDPDDVAVFLQSLVIGIRRDGEVIKVENFDTIYTDNTNEFYQACFFMLQVNYGSFFKGWKLGDTLKQAKSLVVNDK